MCIVQFAVINLVDDNYRIKFTLQRHVVVVSHNWSFYFNKSNIGGRGEFLSFSNDTNQVAATFPSEIKSPFYIHI